MNIALVYDRVNKWGGAERVLLSLHDIWPNAPLYTAVYDSRRASWANVFRVNPSFLQHMPFAKRHHEFYPWLTPMAFESFSFDNYDVVLSVTSAEAKDIITKPGTVHICFCLTPTRYLWSGEKEYIKYSDSISSFFFGIWRSTLKRWDMVAAARPDYYLAISNHVAKRIDKYYQRKVEKIIYPPVDVDTFTPAKTKGDYFLCVSRLVPYKRVDIVIDAFNKLGWPLTIIGSGSSASELKKCANNNVRFVRGDLTDTQLAAYYQKCRAFVSAADEDFGIVSLEAQACGKPVVCLRGSGMAETIVEGKTGKFFNKQSVSSLSAALMTFNKEWYDNALCRKNAEKFSVDRFRTEMKTAVGRLSKNI